MEGYSQIEEERATANKESEEVEYVEVKKKTIEKIKSKVWKVKKEGFDELLLEMENNNRENIDVFKDYS